MSFSRREELPKINKKHDMGLAFLSGFICYRFGEQMAINSSFFSIGAWIISETESQDIVMSSWNWNNLIMGMYTTVGNMGVHNTSEIVALERFWGAQKKNRSFRLLPEISTFLHSKSYIWRRFDSEGKKINSTIASSR